MLRLQIVLRHDPAAVAALESTLLAVSDPQNPRYGQYLSIDDITTMVGPDPSHAEAVRALLLAYSIPPLHPTHHPPPPPSGLPSSLYPPQPPQPPLQHRLEVAWWPPAR